MVPGKTGTTDDKTNAWFVGYTPELVAAVWVGFPDSIRTMRPPATRIVVTGGSWPAQIWQGFAGAFLAHYLVHGDAVAGARFANTIASWVIEHLGARPVPDARLRSVLRGV